MHLAARQGFSPFASLEQTPGILFLPLSHPAQGEQEVLSPSGSHWGAALAQFVLQFIQKMNKTPLEGQVCISTTRELQEAQCRVFIHLFLQSEQK